jgi:hypothetical protein
MIGVHDVQHDKACSHHGGNHPIFGFGNNFALTAGDIVIV